MTGAAGPGESALESWLRSDLGAYLMRHERELIDSRLPGLFGFHLLQLGISRHEKLFENSVIRHRFMLAREAGGREVSALAEPEQLPIESDSVDVVILHHALEFSTQPHQLLREATRVIVPHGHLLILGFNPLSAFGLRARLSWRFGHPVWRSRMLGVRRVSDWLALLDFAVDDVRYRAHALPLNHAGALHRMSALDRFARRWSIPGGGVYMIHACKRYAAMTPVRPRRVRAKPRLIAVPLAPSTRGGGYA